MGRIDQLPYIHAIGDGGPRSRTQVIVIHTTGNTASDEGEAGYATHRADRTSAHFYSDADSVIRALPIGNVAYGCYPKGNAISVQFEITGYDNTVSDAELRQVAPIIAEVCRIYGIPVTRLSPSQVRAGARGICGHADITAAFGEGDHQDGGSRFPWAALMAYVAQAAGQPAPAPAPAPRPAAPAFPLPGGHYFGLITGPAYEHGGANASERAWVRSIQQKLQALGIAPNYAGWADGIYERPTFNAVWEFQKRRGLAVDGHVGPQTWAALFGG